MTNLLLSLTVLLVLSGCRTADPIALDAATDSPVTDTSRDTGMDASTGSLQGTWRLVAFESAASGTSFQVTDRNMPVFVDGVGTVPGRANGWMTIQQTRASLASSLLFTDHIFPWPTVTDYATAFQILGATAGGTLDGDTFRVSGASRPYEYRRNSDGTITYQDEFGGFSTWERALAPAATNAILTTGQAVLFRPTISRTPTRPHVVLVWDLPGGNTLTTNDSPLTFSSNVAQYPLTLPTVPGTATTQVGNTQVALAYILVYEDINNNAFYDAGDFSRGYSSIGIAFRSNGTPDTAFASSKFQDLYAGFQYVHLHPDYSAGGEPGLSPMDPTLPISPDVLVHSETDARPLPDML